MARRPDSLTAPQLPLAPTVQSVHRERGKAIIALIDRALTANGRSWSDAALETGIDNAQLSRIKTGEAHIPGALIAYVLHVDVLGVFAGGICDMCGREAVVKKPDLAAENKELRQAVMGLRAELERIAARLGGPIQ